MICWDMIVNCFGAGWNSMDIQRIRVGGLKSSYCIHEGLL